MPPPFDLPSVQSALAGTPFAATLTHLPTTSSTNTLAIAAAQAGTPTGVWVAEEQTAGRGRGGHTWHSAAGDGLYVSVLLRPRLKGADALKLSLAAGLAAQAAVLEATGIPIDLRWPNDLMVTGPDATGQNIAERKFGGILTESAMEGGDGALSYAVVGIGMNLNHPDLPEDLRALATSLRIVGGNRVSRERVLLVLLRRLLSEVDLLEAEARGAPEAPSLCRRFEQASGWTRGLRVKVDEQDGYTGLTAGLDERGLLQVRLDDDTTRVVRHGGVRRA